MSNINKLRKLQDELKDAVNKVVDDFTQEFMDVYYDEFVKEHVCVEVGINSLQLERLLELTDCKLHEIIDSDEAREDAFDEAVATIRATIKDMY